MNVMKFQELGMGSEHTMKQFGGGGSKTSKAYNPWLSGGGKQFDIDFGNAMRGYQFEDIDFIGSGELQELFRSGIGGFQGIGDMYRQEASRGITGQDINTLAGELYNPAMEEALRGSASKATAEAFSRIGGDTALNRSSGGSRQGIAEGVAASQINEGLTQQLVNYQTALQQQAAGQLESDRQARFGAYEGIGSTIGNQLSLGGSLLDLQRGDAAQEWQTNFMNSPAGKSLLRQLYAQLGLTGSGAQSGT